MLRPRYVAILVFLAFALALWPTLVWATPLHQQSRFTFPYCDALRPPDRNVGLFEAAALDAAPSSPTPGYDETSEYLIGSVAVGIVFLESNGAVDSSTETWTTTRESQVASEITSCLQWLANYNPDADVSFVFDINYRVPTRYEPINRPHTSQGLWISDAMNYLGCSGTSYFTQVRDYANGLRDELGTDWAFTIFVVDSYDDPDGSFTDMTPGGWHYFAYAYIGGPFLVMTYDNNGWGIGNMDNVVAHETLHIFYASDEYDNEAKYSGYLNIRDNDGAYCIMNPDASPGLIWSICSSTKQQIGWRDTDGDKIQDIVDTFPDTSLTSFLPDPTNDSTPTYTGTIKEIPYPNNNPYGSSRDVTINTIVIVQYRVDSGTWLSASATDGAFDEAEEVFTFTTQSLSSGTHKVEVRGTNSVGNVEPSPASDTVVIDTTSPVSSISYSSPSYPQAQTIYVSATTSFTIAASDSISGIARTYYRIDSPTWTTYTSPFTLFGTSEGAHAIHFYSTDKAGNKETSKSISAILDTKAPTLSMAFPVNETAVNSTNVNISWSGSDAASGIDHYEIRIDSGSYSNIGTSTNRILSYLVEGTHKVYIIAIDRLGNSKETLTSFLVDTLAPTVSMTGPVQNYLTSSDNVTTRWKGADAVSGISHYEFQLDDESWLDLGMSTARLLSGLADGHHEFKVKAFDKAGNSAFASVAFAVDTTPPLLSIELPRSGSEIRSSSIKVTWTGSDTLSGIESYEFRLDTAPWANIGTLTTYNLEQLSDGDHSISIRAFDMAGNNQEAQIKFTVNTSLIGGPGWLDDIVVFSAIGIASTLTIAFILIKRKK